MRIECARGADILLSLVNSQRVPRTTRCPGRIAARSLENADEPVVRPEARQDPPFRLTRVSNTLVGLDDSTLPAKRRAFMAFL
jgi:hypothetical protein